MVAQSSRPATELPRSTAELHNLFVQGRAPDPPLNGRYDGVLLRMTMFPPLDPLATAVARYMIPWLGKRFDAARQRGDNRLKARFAIPVGMLWPRYRGITHYADGTVDSLVFRTWVGPSLLDPEISVLKIDYDVPETPYTVRRVLDELVQLPDGQLLGNANLKTWWGPWATVAYFTLWPAVRPG